MSCARARRASARSSTARRTASSCWTSSSPWSTSTARPAKASATAARSWSACTPAISMPGLDEPAIARLAERAGAGQRVTFETRHRRKDGTVFPVEIRTGTFKQAGQLFYLALVRDISERKLRRGSVAGERQRAADGPDGACSRVAADDAGRADHVGRSRGQPAAGGDDRQRRRRARAGSPPIRPRSRKRARRSTTSPPTASGRARSSRESARSRSTRRRAWSCWMSTARFSKSSRSRSTSCAATTSFSRRSSTRRCGAWRAIASSCSRCC